LIMFAADVLVMPFSILCKIIVEELKNHTHVMLMHEKCQLEFMSYCC